MDLVDPTILFWDSLGLLIQLGEDESELLLNLHGDLEAAPGSRLTDTNITILDLGLYLELEYLSGVYSNDGNGRRRPTRAAARRQLPASGNNQDKSEFVHLPLYIAITAVAYSSLMTQVGSNYLLHSGPVTRVLGFFSLLLPSLRQDAGRDSTSITMTFDLHVSYIFVYFCTR